MKRLALTIALILGCSMQASAVPTYNASNGHYYERFTEPINWIDAELLASSKRFMGVSGHLATITSDSENWWIVNNLGGAMTLDHWLGGYLDQSTNEWKWVTGGEKHRTPETWFLRKTEEGRGFLIGGSALPGSNPPEILTLRYNLTIWKIRLQFQVIGMMSGETTLYSVI